MSSTLKLALPALLLLFLIPISPVCNELAAPTCFTLAWILVPILMFLMRLSPISLLALTAVFALQSQWGIAQFVVQHDLGFQLIGESILSADAPAVAKFAFNGAKLIRAYGPYPHANIFGGVMVLAVAGIVLTKRPLWIRWILPIVLLAILLSFSRAAYLGCAVVLVVWGRRHIRNWLPILLISIALSPLILMRFTDSDDQALVERLRGYTWATTIITQHPITDGSGLRAYERTLETMLQRDEIPHNAWEVAPVHSVPLLLGAEFGLLPAAVIIGLSLLFLAPGRSIVVAAMLPSLLLDHYYLTNIMCFTVLAIFLFARVPICKPSSI